MGKVKGLELWWQLYVASLPERDVRNIRPLDFCWTECTKELHVFSSADPRLTWTNENRCRVSTVLVNSLPVLIARKAIKWCSGWLLSRLLPCDFCDGYCSVACGCGQTENVLTNLHLSPSRIFLLIAQRCECLYKSVLVFGICNYFLNVYFSKIRGVTGQACILCRHPWM